MQRYARDSLGIDRNSVNRPPLRNAEQYQRNLYIVEKYFQCATIPLLTMRVCLHSFSRCCLPNLITSAKFRENFNLQQFKVIQGRWFWYQSKACAHYVPISHLIVTLFYLAPYLRYGDLLAENCIFSLPLSHSAPPLPMFSSEFCGVVNDEETRVLESSEDRMIVAGVILAWYRTVTDRQNLS